MPDTIGGAGTRREVAECFPVSDFVIEEMAERGWTRDDLVEMAGWTYAAFNALLTQQEPLTADQAADLERVFGTSQRFWLNLELSYRRWKHSARRERFARARRAASSEAERSGISE